MLEALTFENFEENFKSFYKPLPYLSERQLQILDERFDSSNSAIAERLGVSRQRIDQIHTEAIKKIIRKEYKNFSTTEKSLLFGKIKKFISKTKSSKLKNE